MTRKEIDSAIGTSMNNAQLADQLATLAKRDRKEMVDLVMSRLDKRDTGYTRTVKALLELMQK
jgi:hypothetical protein